MRVSEPHEPREERWPHFGDSCSNGMTLLAVKIPKDGRHRLIIIFAEANLHSALQQLVVELMIDGPRLADA